MIWELLGPTRTDRYGRDRISCGAFNPSATYPRPKGGQARSGQHPDECWHDRLRKQGPPPYAGPLRVVERTSTTSASPVIDKSRFRQNTATTPEQPEFSHRYAIR